MKISIERVSNGYIIRDEEEATVVANDDALLAAQEMLFLVNELIGRDGDIDGERQMSITLAPSRRWREYHPQECSHSQSVEHWAYAGEEGWQCPCGQKFALLTDEEVSEGEALVEVGPEEISAELAGGAAETSVPLD